MEGCKWSQLLYSFSSVSPLLSSQINDNDKSIYKAFKCTDALFVLHVLDGMGFTDNNTEWSIKFVSQVRSHDSHVTVSPPTYIRSAD